MFDVHDSDESGLGTGIHTYILITTHVLYIILYILHVYIHAVYAIG